MADFTTLAHRYIEVWNTTDPTRRRELIEQVFTDDADYVDPLGAVRGRDGIDTFVTGVQQQFAGLTFHLDGPVDGHHDIARFRWRLGVGETEEPVAIGFDVIATTGGRIDRTYGFLDKIPA